MRGPTCKPIAKNGTLKKKKLLVEITKKQSKDYQNKVRAIMREAEKQVAHGTKFLALKEWAKNKRRGLAWLDL